MSLPLQKTKLFLPAARPQLVERTRLLERLDDLNTAGCRAAVISAPAGSGKTTLVAQWLKRTGLPAGWVSLDERDNLPARFFAYLIAALQPGAPGAGAAAAPLLDLPGVDLEEVVGLLANDLAEAPGPFVLALDDFHTLTNPQLQRAVDLLIEAQPPQMRLMLLSREDPALQLARRRARGQLVELRQGDLRFTLPEALEFLNRAMGLDLSHSQVERLEARTEGWIAGLQLAALSLQHTPDAARFIEEFSGSHRFILDYLVEEVLAHQTGEVQTFLLETSILERMNAGLCAALSAKSPAQSQALLEQLARANLFVIPLDEERRWYRYHHLFGDLLRARLQAAVPERTAGLHRRASDGFEAQGDARSAVEHALKGQDAQHAASLIERHFAERWQTVDLEFMLMVQRLPAEVIAVRPALCLQSAWVQVVTGQAGLILPLLEAAECCLADPRRIPEPADAASRAFARTLRVYLSDIHNQPVELDAALAETYAAIPEENTGMRNSAAVVIGTIHYMEGDFTGAARYFEDAAERDRRTGGTNAIPIATARRVWILLAQGRLREALRVLTLAESYVRAHGSRRFYISGALNLLWGEILMEWNDLEGAADQIREGLSLLEDWPSPPILIQGFGLLARVHTARGDLAQAAAALERVEEVLRAHTFHPEILVAVDRARVRLWIAQNQRSALGSWVEQQTGLFDIHDMSFRYEARRIELCRAWLALGRAQDAAVWLEKMDAAAQTGGRSGHRVTILALLAAARTAEPARALDALDEALRLAEPEGYVRTFVLCGEALRQVIKAWLAQRGPQAKAVLREYARRILAACESEEAHTRLPSAAAAKLAEALSQRELEVLGLVAQGLTNQQIAARLVISIRTVKKHMENIHGKLGVQNRTQAVAAARELGIFR